MQPGTDRQSSTSLNVETKSPRAVGVPAPRPSTGANRELTTLRVVMYVVLVACGLTIAASPFGDAYRASREQGGLAVATLSGDPAAVRAAEDAASRREDAAARFLHAAWLTAAVCLAGLAASAPRH